MEQKPGNPIFYATKNGKAPLREWLRKLKDKIGKAQIENRILQLSSGNHGKIRDLGQGLKELKINVGPGYRVYYSEVQGLLILLLCGGDKTTQSRDIKKARGYLDDYKNRH